MPTRITAYYNYLKATERYTEASRTPARTLTLQIARAELERASRIYRSVVAYT